MKIASIETFTKNPISIVRVTTDDGAEGWGQISPFNSDISALVLHRQVAPHVLGADPLDTEALCDGVVEAEYKFPGTYVCRALCGVDTALWDLRGRLEGKSVCELLGGRPRPLSAYASSMRRDITPEDEAARLLRLREQFGYTACKVRIGKVCGHDQDQWPGRTEALVAGVRNALGDDVVIKVDANSCYTPARAIEVGRMLEQHNISHFEEPCPYWELEWTAQVAEALDIPVAGGEQDFHLPTWRRMIDMRAVDIVQPDVCYVGGLTRARRVARMGAAAGLKCVPHSANRSMVTVFTLHLLGAIENAGEHFELSIEPTKWAEGLYEPALEVRDGKVMVPPGAGWGVTISKQWLAGAERQVSTAQ